ncbi:MAG TPA: hypothetical protein VHE34_08090 [Puia sp.]|uniref:hypothetical protein n=1 Tax=Puia sp. TaxID=2045100 RepID=UPI002D0FFD04|nr:hypothetical protein [Puia sp.]HVU95167.1 hypothetical protein [Puia sp.]
MKAVAKIVAVAFTAAVIVAGNPLTTLANGGENKKAATEQQVTVKYQGATNNAIAFKVEFENPTGEKFSLIIKNDNGDIVYHQQFSDAHFSRNVFIADTDSDIHPTFVIRTADNTEIVRQFQVSKTVTENTVATQL